MCIRDSLSTAVWVGYPNDRTQMLGLYHGANVAGATFPSEIWNSYMSVAKGKFCGDFPPPKTPFVAQPFFGRYTTSGGGKGNPTEGADNSVETPAPTDSATPEASPDDTGDTGTTKPDTGTTKPDTGGGDQGFDPEKYEAPPQPSPGDNGNGNGNGGGTQAPPG